MNIIVEQAEISRNFLLLPERGVAVTTTTNVNLIIGGKDPTVVLTRKDEWREVNGEMQWVDVGLVTQTGMTNTGFEDTEKNEPVRKVVVRETDEEAGIIVNESDPLLIGYRHYDCDPHAPAHAYFTTVHANDFELRTTGREEPGERLDPPQKVSLRNLFDPTDKSIPKMQFGHRMHVALSVIALGWLGLGRVNREIAYFLAEFDALARERMNDYEAWAMKAGKKFLIITPAQEILRS